MPFAYVTESPPVGGVAGLAEATGVEDVAGETAFTLPPAIVAASARGFGGVPFR
jgi:hypothetical protein